MSMNKDRFKDDIESAERKILIISWLGVLSAVAVIVCAVLELV
jgi:hypothetical protein